MKYTFSILIILLLFNPAQAQSIWGKTINCEDSIVLKELDSLRLAIRNDDRLTPIRLANALLLSMEEKSLTECQIYYQALLEQAKAYSRDLKLEKALELLHTLLSKVRKKDLRQIEAFTYIEIALVHEYFKNWDDCKANLDKANLLIEKYDLTKVRPQYYVRISSYTRFQGTKDDAYEYAVKAVETAISAGDRFHQLEGYFLQGVTAKNLEISIKNLLLVAHMYGEFGDYISKAAQFLNIANAIGISKDEGQMYMDSARVILQNVKIHNKDYYGVSSFYHKIKKDYFLEENNIDSAFVHAELSFEAEKIGWNTENSEKVAFQVMELYLDEMRNDLSETEKDKKLLKRFVVLAINALGLFAILLFLLFKSRQKLVNQSAEIKKNNDSLHNLNEKNAMLLSEVHHRVKNNLQNIIGLIHLKQSQTSDQHEELFMDDISSKIFSMSLIHEQLYNEAEFSKINMPNYLSSLVEKFKSIIDSDLEVNFALAIDEIYLNIETVMPLGIIITEMITNSIKHNVTQPNLKISLELHETDGFFELVYSDTGMGFASEKVNTKGTGLNIIKGLSKQLRGEYTLDASKGFKATLRFKEKFVSKI